jgi:hypothetical protein
MNIEFEDIKIISFDADASYKSDTSPALTNCILRLSSSAPYAWETDFNNRWSEHFYMMKRRATVSGNSIEVICHPDELQNLINELNKVAAQTNRSYAQHVAEARERSKQQEEMAAAENAQLAQVKQRLQFD